MASTPKQSNGNLPSNNGSGVKRKKSRGSKGNYLSKWLDKTMHHIQESTPSSEVYDTYVHSNTNWPTGSQFAPGYDPYKYNIYGCASEPMSLPSLPTYYNPMIPPPYSEYRYIQNEHKSIQVQRPRQRRRSENKAEELSSTPADTPMNQTKYLQPKNYSDSQDFASLPPIVTSMGDTNSNSDIQTNEKDDASNARRFSDPCVRGLPDVTRPNGEVDSGSEASSGLSGSQVGSRLLSCLLDQISNLKLNNERLNKELQETRAELENMRHHNTYFPKGPNSMGAPTNLNGSGGQYSPGFLTDLVREIRDASRMREEAMYARLRTLVLERTDSGLSSAESKLAERTLEEIKSSLRASEADKRRMMDRILKMEDEIRALRLSSGYDPNDNRMNGNVEDADSERLRLRKELTDMRKAKQSAEEHALKLERLVTQLRSKFNGLQITNGPDSLPSDHEPDTRTRRTTNSTNTTNNMTNSSTNNLANLPNLSNLSNTSANSTVVFGPVTDL
ncbi:uncharacterized protein LOC124538489 isoform X1 [Vanessa cardui]|uniref:uncharacterized protein LOC124538489 isoform X1 n=1 Tax=Vanessa cardui TaxID=171605 RepID=UPI001F1474D8|nr:uncharacterized protein LOC124538489 isoform X1 [Vanessa cardui]